MQMLYTQQLGGQCYVGPLFELIGAVYAISCQKTISYTFWKTFSYVFRKIHCKHV